MAKVYEIVGRFDPGQLSAMADDSVVARDDDELLLLEETTVEAGEA